MDLPSFTLNQRRIQMTETKPKKTFKQVCTCEKCGNEAEMIITCSLESVEETPEVRVAADGEPQSTKKQIPGQATCTHCGNEAEILVDIG
jgi:hypothetical protein